MGDVTIAQRLSWWRDEPLPGEGWRRRARAVMRDVIREHWDGRTDRERLDALMRMIDAAYPFESRVRVVSGALFGARQ